MDCKKIRGFLITDYIDKEAGRGLKDEISRHLSGCSGCREYEKTLRRAALEPFKKAHEIKVPDEVWAGISEAITKEKSYWPAWLTFDVRDFLTRIFSVPKPAFAVMTALIGVILVTTFVWLPFGNQEPAKNYLQDQMAFLVSLDTDEASAYSTNYAELDTNIEEYFF